MCKTLFILIVGFAATLAAQDAAVPSQANVFGPPQRFMHPLVLDCRSLSGEPLSIAGRAKIACDSSTFSLKASVNGGAFAAFGGGSGTVTTVGAGTIASIFTFSVANATTTPAISLSFSAQLANCILAGPASGSAAAPTCRAMVANDIPSLAPSKITGTAVVTSDSRLSDSRTPTAHASTHAAAGSDPVTLTEAQVTNLTSDLGGKQATGNYLTAITGDVAASGPGSVAATLATVNSSPGTTGDATHTSTIVTNGKGLVTSNTSVAIAIPESAVTNLTADLSAKLVKASNLSDLSSASAARTNLALGSLATQNGTFSGTSSGTNTGDQIVPVNTTPTSSQWFRGYDSSTGAFTKSQPAFNDLSGSITGSQIPTGTVTDTLSSLSVKPSVGVVAASNVTLSGAQTIDGIAGTAGTTIVLATAQTAGAENGPWVMQSGAWTRPTWYPSGGTTQAFQFITTLVRLGATYQGSTWRMTTSGTTTIDTTATTWAQTPVVEGGLSFSDITTANATTSLHGLLPKLGGGTSNFLRADGTWAAPSVSPPFSDATGIVMNSSDNTKVFKVSASGITTGNTVTMTPPIATGSYTAARQDAAQTFTGVQTFGSGPVVPSGTASAPGLVFTTSNFGLYRTSIGFGTTVGGAQYADIGSVDGAIVYDTSGLYWSTTVTATKNTGLSRVAAGVVGIGTGAQGSVAGSLRSTYVETVKGSDVASAATITATSGLFHVTGTTQITTINLPRTGYTGCLRVIPDGAFTTATGGNIALASTAVVNRVIEFCYDGTSWYPSY